MQITVNGLRIHYRLQGPADAPVVTLSNSLATDLSMWEPQIPVLISTYRVLRYDSRGHGETGVPEGPYTLQQLTDDVRALLLALGIQRTHFVGLSMGGIVGQMLALQHPQLLQSLVLCDTMSRVHAEARPVWQERIRIAQTQGMEFLVEPTIQRWFTAAFRTRYHAVVEQVRTMIRRTPVVGYIGCCQAIVALDLTERLEAITVPTRVIVGEEDPGTPVSASETIHRKIQGSDLVILKAAAHLSNLQQPAAFNQALTTFLGQF